jgi:hypothetical protein
MKTTTVGLANLINSGVFMDVTLYTIALAQGGPTLYISAADFDVNASGTTFVHGKPGVDPKDNRPKAHWKAGLDVDSFSLTIIPRLVDPATGAAFPDKIGSTPLVQAAASGAFDGALVTTQRAYFPSAPQWPMPAGGFVPTGVLKIFFGMVGEVDPTAYDVTLQVQSLMQLLTVKMPRNVYQATCPHILYDARCTLSQASFTTGFTVAAPLSQNSVTANSTVSAPAGSGNYQFGRLTFTSGVNAGVTKTIAGVSGNTFVLHGLLPYAPSAGDTFTASAGCDKQIATCQLFSNLANFGGTPYIPVPEVQI